MYCQYYHIRMVRDKICLVVGLLRAELNLSFDRTAEGHKEVFEFFVTSDQEQEFLDFMYLLQRKGYVVTIEKKVNRYLP